MTTHSITSTITKLVGPDAEEIQVPVCVVASITPAEHDVGIMNVGWEDLVVTDDDGGEIEVDEDTENRLGEELVKSYLDDAQYDGPEFEYD